MQFALRAIESLIIAKLDFKVGLNKNVTKGKEAVRFTVTSGRNRHPCETNRRRKPQTVLTTVTKAANCTSRTGTRFLNQQIRKQLHSTSVRRKTKEVNHHLLIDVEAV